MTEDVKIDEAPVVENVNLIAPKPKKKAEKASAENMIIAPNEGKPEAVEYPIVKVRVLKKAHGRISTGEHMPGHGDFKYAGGAVFECPLDVAQALEAAGHAEIED